MPSGADASSLIAEADALIAQAQRSLEGTEGFFSAHGEEAGQMLAQLKLQREEEHAQAMRHFALEQVGLALQQPGLPGAEIHVDPATLFARRVRRRRVIV